MTRLAVHRAPLHAPGFWDTVETAFRGFSRRFAAGESAESGLATLEREQARIRLESRHWLMG